MDDLDIRQRLFLLQDKIKMAWMFIDHAQREADKIQEMIFDKEEEEWLEKISTQNKR